MRTPCGASRDCRESTPRDLEEALAKLQRLRTGRPQRDIVVGSSKFERRPSRLRILAAATMVPPPPAQHCAASRSRRTAFPSPPPPPNAALAPRVRAKPGGSWTLNGRHRISVDSGRCLAGPARGVAAGIDEDLIPCANTVRRSDSALMEHRDGCHSVRSGARPIVLPLLDGVRSCTPYRRYGSGIRVRAQIPIT